MIYYIETKRYNDGKYVDLIERVFGEKPKYVEVDGVYTAYSLETEPITTDQKWAVGSTQEAMLKKGLIGGSTIGSTIEYGLAVRPHALKDPSIIDVRPIGWDDLTPEAQDLLSR